MIIERQYRKLEDIEEVSIYDVQDLDFYNPTPQEFEVEKIPVEELMNNIDTDIHVLFPFDDGNDFIIQSLGSYTLKRGNFNKSDVQGRLLSKISPMFYEILKDSLFDVYKSHTTKKMRFFYYSGNNITRLTNVKIVFEVGRLFILTDNIDTSHNNLLGSDEFSEDNSYLLEYVSQTGSFSKVDGVYSWSPGIYNIVNRRREEYDKYYNVVFDLVISEDKTIVDNIFKELDEGHATHLERVIRIRTHDGILKYLEVSIYSTFDDGNLINRQGLINDVTHYSNTQITKPVDFLMSGFKNSKKLALMIEPLNSKRYEFSEGFYNLIEKTPEEYVHSLDVVGKIVEKEAQNQIIRIINREISEIDVTFTLHIGGDNPKDKIVELYMESFEFGGMRHSIGFLTDVTEEKIKQKELVDANEHQLVLIKEVHHRVKNNLQVLNSFLNLEKRAYKDNPGIIIDHMQTRLTSLALLHEKTYNTTDFKNINLRDFILDQDNQLRNIVGMRDGVELESHVDEDLNLTIEVITPLLLVVDELTMNAIKHAFPDKSVPDKKITKIIRKIDDDTAELIVQDNGVGIEDPSKVSSNLGCEIIKSLTRQLDGEIKLIEHKKGTGYRLIFPIEMKHTIEG
ncbi:histidine kinase dimerization/phosphoacceptor domain -containing protein [Methanobrevibacter sp.]|uniref:histidine kinase dimerization/phosphoacceptor domain -containing protein n=1 Tax=Methanobrevibacter sp. TaxID=66852 RepID=UPI00388D345D